MKDLTVIVPRLPPSIDGLGDYGLSLARQMKRDYGVNTCFIIGDPLWKGPDELEGFEIRQVLKRSKKEMLSLISPNNPVLLHYVGYGYAKRGCPVWLVQALKEWKSASGKKCITMFHECYAFGPIWSSQFWTSPLQRKLVADLSLLSDRCLTSKKTYAEIIQRFSKFKHTSVVVLPVFSNIGELEKSLALVDRNKTLVVFGNVAWRSRVYRHSLIELKNLIGKLQIKKLIDIGRVLDFSIDLGEGVEVEVLGNLPAEQISEIFSKSLAGFFNYPTGYLSKSGIFASYCAHGLLPVGNWDKEQESDGVVAGVHFLAADDINEKVNFSDIQKIADNAFYWYQSHNLTVHSKTFTDILD